MSKSGKRADKSRKRIETIARQAVEAVQAGDAEKLSSPVEPAITLAEARQLQSAAANAERKRYEPAIDKLSEALGIRIPTSERERALRRLGDPDFETRLLLQTARILAVEDNLMQACERAFQFAESVYASGQRMLAEKEGQLDQAREDVFYINHRMREGQEELNELRASIDPPDYLRRYYGGWIVRYAGGEPFPLPALVGVRYVAELLANPEKRIAPWTLSRLGNPPVGDTASQGEAAEAGLTPMTMTGEDEEDVPACPPAEIKEMLKQARADRQKASTPEERENLDKQIEWLEEHHKHLRKDGRPRRTHSEAERARLAVYGAIKRAREEISEKEVDDQKPLSRHLESSLTYSIEWSYIPEAPVDWHISL